MDYRSCMLKRKYVLPPEHIYPADEWRLDNRAAQNQFDRTWYLARDALLLGGSHPLQHVAEFDRPTHFFGGMPAVGVDHRRGAVQHEAAKSRAFG